MTKQTESGLTLIEVLIALAITAIALLAVVKASNDSIENFSYLEQKTYAIVVANNALSSIQLHLITAPISNQKSMILQQTFYWSAAVINTQTPHLTKIIIAVKSAADQAPVYQTQGFVFGS